MLKRLEWDKIRTFLIGPWGPVDLSEPASPGYDEALRGETDPSPRLRELEHEPYGLPESGMNDMFDCHNGGGGDF